MSKIMTCKQLGGACEVEFMADTFKEMAEISQKHAREMLEMGEEAHVEAMKKMRVLMSSPESMEAFMKEKEQAFNDLENLS